MTSSVILKTINSLPIEERMDNPTPSGDPWFDDPLNVAIVMEGIQSAKEEKCVSLDESPVLSAIFSKYR